MVWFNLPQFFSQNLSAELQLSKSMSYSHPVNNDSYIRLDSRILGIAAVLLRHIRIKLCANSATGVRVIPYVYYMYVSVVLFCWTASNTTEQISRQAYYRICQNSFPWKKRDFNFPHCDCKQQLLSSVLSVSLRGYLSNMSTSGRGGEGPNKYGPKNEGFIYSLNAAWRGRGKIDKKMRSYLNHPP